MVPTESMTSKPPKFRVLCLHGIGTNSEIFEAQIAPLTYELGDDYEFDFVEGTYPWPMAAGIREAFGDQICYSYHDGSAESALDVARDLSTYVGENGPFDAVMGFSLGAALAATLLLGDAAGHTIREVETQPVDSDASPRHSPIFRCAIFLSGTLPCDWNELTRRNLSFLHASDVKHHIQIPTLHVWSPADTEYPHQSEELAEMCVSQGRTAVLHNDGHAPPVHQESIHSTANAIRKLVANLSWESKR